MRSFSGDRLWLVIGLVMEQRPAEARAGIAAHMPPPVRDMWQGSGQAEFVRFITALRS